MRKSRKGACNDLAVFGTWFPKYCTSVGNRPLRLQVGSADPQDPAPGMFHGDALEEPLVEMLFHQLLQGRGSCLGIDRLCSFQSPRLIGRSSASASSPSGFIRVGHFTPECLLRNLDAIPPAATR